MPVSRVELADVDDVRPIVPGLHGQLDRLVADGTVGGLRSWASMSFGEHRQLRPGKGSEQTRRERECVYADCRELPGITGVPRLILS